MKQQEIMRLSICLLHFSLAISMALLGVPYFCVYFAVFGMLFLVAFFDIWLEPEKWRQKQ